MRAARHVHVSSFFLQRGLQPGLPALLDAARAHGATTSLDPGWDPDERGRRRCPCSPSLDYLLPNAAEALALAQALRVRGRAGWTPRRSLAARGSARSW